MTGDSAFFTNQEYVRVNVKRGKKMGFFSGVSDSDPVRFCWSLRFGLRDPVPRPATISFLLILNPPPPSCCLLIINEGKDNVSEQGLSVLPHSCGWLSAQVQSCRRFWHCRSPQAPTGRSTAPHASSSEPGGKHGDVAGMRQEHVR